MMVFAKKLRSSEHVLLDIINQIETNMDLGTVLMWDFYRPVKAFVDHRILLSNLKLHHYGVPGIINDLFSSYGSSANNTNWC